MPRPNLAILAPLALAAAALAGPLTPPAGPVTSTLKTLTEVEPRIAINASNTPGDNDTTPSLYKISQPGSYYLTGNLQGVSGKIGIEVTVSGVTIDLNGFTMIGGAGSLAGIKSTGGSELSAVTVRNGVITLWGSDGIDLFITNAFGCVIDRVRSAYNGGNGFQVYRESILTDCTAANNGGYGFNLYQRTTVRNCMAITNAGNGFDVAPSTVLQACIARENHAIGFHASGGDVTIDHCQAVGNTGAGIDTGQRSSITECTANYNVGGGIVAAGYASLLRNTCCGNGVGNPAGAGILVNSAGNRIEANNVTANTVGYRVTATGNILLRNSAAANSTNWSVVAGNACFVVNAAAGAAINGNSGGAALGGADANANYTY